VIALRSLLLVSLMLGCAAERREWENTFTGDGEDLFVLDDDLACLADAMWTEVEGTRVANLLGHEEEAVAFARSGVPGEFPIGTIVQLLPEEVSVKRGLGFSSATRDWEFLKLSVAGGRSVITERGTSEIGNPGGSCLSCHQAAVDFDLACFTNDKCAPLPFFIDTDIEPETEDPRCRSGG
jgi:hypothetical protein